MYNTINVGEFMLVTEIKSLNNIDKYNVDTIIVPTKYSAVSDFEIELHQLDLFKDKKIALKLDKIITENYTEMIKSICQKRLYLFGEQRGMDISEDIVTYLGMYSFEEEGKTGRDLIEEALQLGADCVGGIPHNEWLRELGEESVK